MNYFPKPYSIETDKYIDQFNEDLRTFCTMKHDPNTCVGDLDSAYVEFCNKIASRLQDLALNAWIDGNAPSLSFQELKISSEKDAAIIVDVAVYQMEAINGR